MIPAVEFCCLKILKQIRVFIINTRANQSIPNKKPQIFLEHSFSKMTDVLHLLVEQSIINWNYSTYQTVVFKLYLEFNYLWHVHAIGGHLSSEFYQVHM